MWLDAILQGMEGSSLCEHGAERKVWDWRQPVYVKHGRWSWSGIAEAAVFNEHGGAEGYTRIADWHNM
jgi:hypothetical protein